MARVLSRDTEPELVVRRLLHGLGLRFRLHVADLPGCPDIVIPRYRQIVFVHGCFWHRHAECRRGQSTPATHQDYWLPKFARNVERDCEVREALEALGWKVTRVWECETLAPNRADLKACLCRWSESLAAPSCQVARACLKKGSSASKSRFGERF